MKLSGIENDDMLSYVGLHKTNADFIVYGDIPEEYTYSKWMDICNNFCNRKRTEGILNSVGALNVIQSEGRILAYFIVEYIEVFKDFYGIGMNIYNRAFDNGYNYLGNADVHLPPSMRDYISDKINGKKCHLKPYVTPPRKDRNGDILPDKIHYFILKLL